MLLTEKAASEGSGLFGSGRPENYQFVLSPHILVQIGSQFTHAVYITAELVVIPAEQFGMGDGDLNLFVALYSGSQEGFGLEGDKAGAGMVFVPLDNNGGAFADQVC